ncbi:hypothetical protein HYH02_004192 [Chlamydomonas schloesseri]|uniref:Nuclear pore complex protein Nup85 n=1 Tax=Chlamydomonas schloesseri TaxID=2026947 RepID=A0A836B9B0_9CHLO|nr:hypothetical protein HYH02_004192 [Chlamydomonas schloesseri]|eukprot:KAG2451597.1 hypothetical protein HYH02_004192 [Chlamydomonas schloesseri]
MSADGPTTSVPVAPGSRLHFSWGLGSELRLMDIQDPSTQEGGEGGHATQLSWGQVSASNRIIAFGTAEQYAEVQRSRLAGTRDDAHLTRVGAYARAVRERLLSLRDAGAGGAEGADDDGGLAALEAALWQLLEVFFVDAPRNDGNLGEDFVSWLATHGDALAALTGQPTLGGRLEELKAAGAGGSSSSSASSSADAAPDYWPLLRRLVALGRTAEALELLDCHDAKRAALGGAASAGALQQPGLRAQLELLDCLHVLLKRLPRLAPSSSSAAAAPGAGAGAAGGGHGNGAGGGGGGGGGGRGGSKRLDASARAYGSLAEFGAARAVWRREAGDIAAAEQLFSAAAAASRRTAEGVRSVLGVLLGEPAALRAATTDWLEAAAAEVVHRAPDGLGAGGGGGGAAGGGGGGGGVVSANQLGALLAAAQAARGGEGASGLLDLLAELLQALCEADVAGVVTVLSNSGVASSWLMAHSLELIAAYVAAGGAATGGGGGALVPTGGGGAAAAGGGGGGLLSRRLAVSGCDLMEYFRLAWAESLLPVGVLGGGWALALGYLAWCPTHGAAAAEALMEALPVDSRDTRGLEKALAACRRLGLGAAAAVLCRVAGVDALGRGMLGAGAQWMVRASDPRRTAAALALVGGAVEEALLARMVGGGAAAAAGAAGAAVASLGGASYRAGALQLPGGDELEALLEWLPGGGSSGGAAADEGGSGSVGGGSSGGSGGRGLAAFLVDVLRLSRAMGALGAARDSNASPENPRVTEALSAGRAALLSMARRRTPPRRLCLPLLFYCIPLLEASASSGRLFSSADMQDLLAWAGECARGGAMAPGGAWALGVGGGAGGGLGPKGLGALAAAAGVPERYAKDVQLALVRAVARSHVMENSGGAGAPAVLAAAGAAGAGAGVGAGAGAGVGAFGASGGRQVAVGGRL